MSWFTKLFGGNGSTNSPQATEAIMADEQAGATKFPGVVVGKIVEVKDHPNADRLKLTKVDIGNQELAIVCGGPNVQEGQLVAVALVGATLPNGQKIKKAAIRGVKSFGMVCAEDELSIGPMHESIIALKTEAPIGGPIDAYLP